MFCLAWNVVQPCLIMAHMALTDELTKQGACDIHFGIPPISCFGIVEKSGD